MGILVSSPRAFPRWFRTVTAYRDEARASPLFGKNVFDPGTKSQTSAVVKPAKNQRRQTGPATSVIAVSRIAQARFCDTSRVFCFRVRW